MLMAAFIIIDGSFFAIYAVLSALFHEIAHIVTLRLLGGKANEIRIKEIGISLRTGLMGYKTEAIVALSGPLASFFAFLVFFIISRYFVFAKWSVFLTASNLALFIINILPVYPLDGGRALYCILSLSTPRAGRYVKIISVIFLLPLCVISVIILISTGYNFSLVLICIYLSIFLGVKDV